MFISYCLSVMELDKDVATASAAVMIVRIYPDIENFERQRRLNIGLVVLPRWISRYYDNTIPGFFSCICTCLYFYFWPGIYTFCRCSRSFNTGKREYIVNRYNDFCTISQPPKFLIVVWALTGPKTYKSILASCVTLRAYQIQSNT